MPTEISDWHKLRGFDWFEWNIIDLLARMACQPAEDPSRYCKGAVFAMDRLRQKTWTKPFAIQDIRRVPIYDRLGVVNLQLQLSLHAPDATIFRRLKAFLARERRKRGISVVSARPTKMANLKRDYVIYVLDRSGWKDIGTIEKQLAHMGCLGFPANFGHQDYVRKVRARFRSLQAEIVRVSRRPMVIDNTRIA